MDWSDLPHFLAVARAGQIARASAAVGSDATTVSRRIRRLEHALGERLFEQHPGGQSLTPAGIALLDKAERMAELAASIGPVDSSPRHIKGSVRVSVAEGFGAWFISRHLGELAAQQPNLEIDLVANSGFLNPTRRETDLAVLLARPSRGPLITRKLTDYSLRLYAALGYLHGRAAPATPEALRDHRLIGYIPDMIYAPELLYLDELPIDRQPQLRSSSINAQHQMIASGAGIGVLPCFIGDSDPSLVRVIPAAQISRTFWLVTHQETRDFAPVRFFRNWLTTLVERHRAIF